ncbi:hypothetical protein EVAR_64674_1 [Eumeta japonica]|uniref:Uncharacterized protein n=1 Tax=Eumeta variegata TaxID=151549 RepID=A0A4C1ZTS6_EUMVA|nr:hypothetical protein EVAR_64674_1 [Eumeta japonica]
MLDRAQNKKDTQREGERRMDELSVKWLLYAGVQVILASSACELQEMSQNHSRTNEDSDEDKLIPRLTDDLWTHSSTSPSCSWRRKQQ